MKFFEISNYEFLIVNFELFFAELQKITTFVALTCA